jgi:hypothetical protein
MKKIIVSISILFILPTLLFAQITKKQADKIVSEYIENEITDYHWLYSNDSITPDKNGLTTISTWHKEFVSIHNPCFVYFIDEYPYANWVHPCRYLFVNKKDGQIYVKKAKTPPENMETWKMLTTLPKIQEDAKFDFSKNNPKLRSGINTQNCYAVIISGGYNMSNNHVRYWNDCSAIYSALTNVYGYLDDHIYVLISDGTNPANDRHLISGSYDSSPLDLDGDGDNDIQYAATKSNITTVFNTLSNILTPDDYLFIFTTDHGDIVSGNSILNLWNGETMSSPEFATEVNKLYAGEISVVMEQCYSGGFIPNLTELGRTISTACSANEFSYAMTSLTYDEYVYHWTSAVAGQTPSGSIVNADYNNDGYVSMKEAFDYASNHDTRSETPQYNSTKTYLGNYLTLLGSQACTTTNFTNQTVSVNTTITNCNINVQNVTVSSGKLTLEAAHTTTINGPFDTGTTGQLEIK